MASCQYGGQSISLTHLAPFVDVSRQKIRREVAEELATIGVNDQKHIIEIAEKTYDFGVIKEEDGRVSHVFTFKNVTEGPLTIKNVRASCGCTTPAWSKEPIASGKQAQITVTYNASGRPGAFHKSVTVTLIPSLRCSTLTVSPATPITLFTIGSL